MMKQALKNKMAKHFDLVISVRPGGESEEDEQSKSDLAPPVKDKGMGNEPNPLVGEDMKAIPEHGPLDNSQFEEGDASEDQEPSDDDDIAMLETMGADPALKESRSLRGRAMMAAGQKLKGLKEKKLKV